MSERLQLQRDIEFGHFEMVGGGENGWGGDGGFNLNRQDLLTRVEEITWLNGGRIYIDRSPERDILGMLDPRAAWQIATFGDGWVGVEVAREDLWTAIVAARVCQGKKARLMGIEKDDDGYKISLKKWVDGGVVTLQHLAANRDLWYVYDSGNNLTTIADVGQIRIGERKVVEMCPDVVNGRHGNGMHSALDRMMAHVDRRGGERRIKLRDMVTGIEEF